MGFFDFFRRFHFFGTTVPMRVSAAISADLKHGRGLSLKGHVPTVAMAAVRASIDFEQEPVAELIMRLLEHSERLWLETARAVSTAPDVESGVARRAGEKVKQFARGFQSDLMVQHLTNLVLSETGLGTEAGVLRRGEIDAKRLSKKLSELIRLSVSSVSDAELAMLPLPQPSPQRLASA